MVVLTIYLEKALLRKLPRNFIDSITIYWRWSFQVMAEIRGSRWDQKLCVFMKIPHLKFSDVLEFFRIPLGLNSVVEAVCPSSRVWQLAEAGVSPSWRSAWL